MRFLLLALLLILPATAHAQSVLQTVADAALPGSWTRLTNVGGLSNLFDTGSSGNIISDSTKGCADPVTRRIHFVGIDEHGSPNNPPSRHVVYDEATNSIIRLPDVPYPGGSANHGWDGLACDARNRRMWRRNLNSLTLWEYNLDDLTGTGGWTNRGNVGSGDQTAFAGVGFHYERGRRGILLMPQHNNAPLASINAWNPDTNTHSVLSTSFNCNSANGNADFNEFHKITYIGCATTTAFFRISTSGDTLTQLATKPCTTNYNRGGILHVDPTSGNAVLLCGWTSGFPWYIYNHANNQWVQQAAYTTVTNHVLQFPSSGCGGTCQTWGKIGTTVNWHGGIVYWACNGGSECGIWYYRGTGTFNAATRDFITHCFKGGIIRCVGFDADVDTQSDGAGTQATGISCTPNCPSRDTSIMAAGTSALKWTVPSGQNGNDQGLWGTNFAKDMSIQIGPAGQTPANFTNEYWIQARIRVDSNYATSVQAMSIAPKMFWISDTGDRSGAGKGSCEQQEIVLQPSPGVADVMMVYHACPGAFQPGNQFIFTRECGPGNTACTNTLRQRELQQGDIQNCTYANATGVTGGSGSRDTCKKQSDNPNTWKTFTARLKVGTWYANNSVYTHTSELELWVTEEGGSRTKIINFVNSDPSCPTQTSTLNPDETCGFDIANTSSGFPSNPIDRIGKLWFTTYSNGVVYPSGGLYWLDNLIIALSDPGDPGAAPPPPPSGVPPYSGGAGRIR